MYIAYEVKITCKGPLTPLSMLIVTSKIYFMFFKQQPMVVYILTSVLSTSKHQCHWLSQWLCKHFTIWRMTQNLFKNIISNVASNYQVNLAIGIPNITENYINSHIFTCDIGYLQCLFKYMYISRCWKVFWLARYYSILEGSALIRMCRENSVWS